jgi:hypothetical protein
MKATEVRLLHNRDAFVRVADHLHSDLKLLYGRANDDVLLRQFENLQRHFSALLATIDSMLTPVTARK